MTAPVSRVAEVADPWYRLKDDGKALEPNKHFLTGDRMLSGPPVENPKGGAASPNAN